MVVVKSLNDTNMYRVMVIHVEGLKGYLGKRSIGLHSKGLLGGGGSTNTSYMYLYYEIKKDVTYDECTLCLLFSSF